MSLQAYIRVLSVLIYVWFSVLMAHSQGINEDIHIEAQTSTTAELLEQISKQCQCYFAYPSELVHKKKLHAITSYDGPAETFVRALFPDTINFEYYKNQVILRGADDSIPQKVIKEKELITLSGILKDEKSHQAIPYANISIRGSMLGTISNNNGFFQLKFPSGFQDSTLQISCLGYYTHTVSPSDFKKDTIIYMSLANISLQEVVVRSVATNYIVAQSKGTLDKNYRKSPYGYQAFYRELAMKRGKYVSYNEALFEGFSPKGSISRDNLILRKGRQFTHNEYRDTIQLKLKGGTEAALQLDIANFKPDFLEHNSESYYHYRLNDLVMWHDEMVYVINFTPRQYNSKAIFMGELYISFTDFSLLGASFSYTKQHLKEMKDALIVKKGRKTKVQPTKYNYHVEYQKLNGKYHINYVKGDITLKAKSKNQLLYLEFNTVFEMTLTAIDTTAYSKPKRLKPYRTSSVFSEQIKFSTEEFWHYDNFIVPEDEIMKAFYHSGFTLEEQDAPTSFK